MWKDGGGGLWEWSSCRQAATGDKVIISQQPANRLVLTVRPRSTCLFPVARGREWVCSQGHLSASLTQLCFGEAKNRVGTGGLGDGPKVTLG